MASPTASEGAVAADHRPALTVEELCFASAMSCFEGWLKMDPAIGPRTMSYVTKFISRTLEKTHNLKEVRETLSRSVEVWVWLTKSFAAALPSLTTRSIGPLQNLNDPEKGVTPQESTALITKNYTSLKEDLQLLIKLMHIARNLLVVPEPEIPQDLCAAAQFDKMLYQTITLCVNVTSKAYDGDILEETARHKLSEITELYKKLLITCLQQAHNWIAKNDRNKMSFWSAVLFDDESGEEQQDAGAQFADFRPDFAKMEVYNWIERNSRMCDKARQLLVDYQQNLGSRGSPPGGLSENSVLSWNWMPHVRPRADDIGQETKITPQWKEDEQDKFEQDRLYGRVSREVDTWWLKVRDPNYDEWIISMPSVEKAHQLIEGCKLSSLNRYPHSYRNDDQEGSVHSAENVQMPEHQGPEGEVRDDRHYNLPDYNDDMIEDEDVDDDESYGEGPMSGLLTEVPNILDPKQIEALHMIVKSCILDSAGISLSRAGENLQKTRCRMFLSLECGRSLLREILVFIAVWEKSEQSLIFQLTTQIVEAIHHSALIPFAWQSLRIPKDIISPAQTVLLRLVNNMFRTRLQDPIQPGSKGHLRDIKLLQFLYIQFRTRIVPECTALMHLQTQIRNEVCDPVDFPVDSWDMERAKDGLQQFLDLLMTVNEPMEWRTCLIQWEAVFDLLVLLKSLESAVPKKPMVDLPDRSAHRRPPPPHDDDRDHDYDSADPPPPPPPPPIQEHAHKFPWAGIKGQILHIIAGLLQPEAGRSGPGNPVVQKQILQHNGIISLLNCCVYDDHNRFARERVQICLKWLMDGSAEANKVLHDLVAVSPPPNLQPAPDANGVSQPVPLRVDGIAGEVKVRVKNPQSSSSAQQQQQQQQQHPSAAYNQYPPRPSSAASNDSRTTTNSNTSTSSSHGDHIHDHDHRSAQAAPMAINTHIIDAQAAIAPVRVHGPAPPPPPPAPPAALTLPSLASPLMSVSPSDYERFTKAYMNALPPLHSAATGVPGGHLNHPMMQAVRNHGGRPEDLFKDILTLADEAARLAIGQPPFVSPSGSPYHGGSGSASGSGSGSGSRQRDAEETEEEDFM
ncbi:hypothetical protein B0T09DRAFT_147108 [Sordaria sp. MPI-SDFR-AT-0083]|nr:hypothetical protein B0T09DRAFT_147108 [Sordaria sp. MPI-SDFR-AT-0083]